MSTGDMIRACRTKNRLTQKELAIKSGVAEVTIRQYENNKRQPMSIQLEKIAAALETTVDFLLNGTKEPSLDVLQRVADELGTTVDSLRTGELSLYFKLATESIEGSRKIKLSPDKEKEIYSKVADYWRALLIVAQHENDEDVARVLWELNDANDAGTHP